MNLKENWNKLKVILGLSLSLAKANFKLRNEGSYIGIGWYLLEPLLLFLILISIQGVVNHNIQNYPLYLILGLIMFNFFSGATLNAINSIKANAKFIKSIKINYFSLVLSSTLQALFSHVFEIIILIAFFIIYKASLISLIYYPLIFLVFLIFISGLSLILATVGVYINDLANVWRVLMRLLWFATPIFYAITSSVKFNKALLLNPLYYFINSAREIIIYNNALELSSIYVMIGLSLLSLVMGLIIFNKFKSKFAEIV